MNPLGPEKFAIPYDMLSDYCEKTADEYGIKSGDIKKLIQNLCDKTNYIVHCRNLQLYLSLGINWLTFKECWLDGKNYIDFNTKNITKATDKFEKNCSKLMIKSVYGKTIQNLSKRISVRLGNNEKDFLKHTSKPTHYLKYLWEKFCYY